MKNLEVLEKMLEELENCGDLEWHKDEDGITITIDDFGGFDDDWSEMDRGYTNPEKVAELENWLIDNSPDVEGDLYKSYLIDDVEVVLGYTSFDV